MLPGWSCLLLVVLLNCFMCKYSSSWWNMRTMLAHESGCSCRYLSVPQQENAVDCGVFVMHFAEALCLQQEPDFTIPAEQIQGLRMRYAAAMVNKQLGVDI